MEYSRIMSVRLSSCDIVLSGYFSMSAGYLRTPAGEPAGVPIERFADVTNNPQVADYLLVKREDMNIIAEAGDELMWDELLPFGDCRPVDSEEQIQYENELARFGYLQDASLHQSRICELEPGAINTIADFRHIGSMQMNALTSGLEMLVLVSEETYSKYTGALHKLIGKSISWTRILDFEAEQPERVDLSLSVAAVAIVPPANALFKEAFGDDIYFVVFGDVLEKEGLPALCDRAYLMLDDPAADTALLDRQIYSVLSSGGDMQYRSNKYATAAARKEYQFTVLLLLCLIIPLLGLAFSIIIMGHIARMNERKTTYRQLYVLGMNPSGINKLLLRSYLLYLLNAYALYAIALAYFASDPWYRSMMNGGVLLANIAFAVLLVFVCFPLSVYHKRWMKKNVCFD